MPFLHDVKDQRQGQGKHMAVPKTQKGQTFGNMSDETERHQWNKGPKLKGAATSWN
jgi:hypothetical protein